MNISYSLNLALATTVMLGYFYFDSRISELKKEHAQYVVKINKAANERLLSQRKNTQVMIQKVSQLDKELHDEKIKAKSEINALKRNIRNGTRKLYVKADCNDSRLPATSSTASSNHGEANAKLDAETSEKLIEITEDGDNAIRQLTACQQYIRENNDARKRP